MPDNKYLNRQKHKTTLCNHALSIKQRVKMQLTANLPEIQAQKNAFFCEKLKSKSRKSRRSREDKISFRFSASKESEHISKVSTSSCSVQTSTTVIKVILSKVTLDQVYRACCTLSKTISGSDNNLSWYWKRIDLTLPNVCVKPSTSTFAQAASPSNGKQHGLHRCKQSRKHLLVGVRTECCYFSMAAGFWNTLLW